MLAVMALSQHRVSSFKTVRPRASCGARCMRHVIRSDCGLFRGAAIAIWCKSETPFVHGRIESPNTSSQAIEPDSSYSRQAYSYRPGTGHGYENMKPGCIHTVLRVPSIIRPLRR